MTGVEKALNAILQELRGLREDMKPKTRSYANFQGKVYQVFDDPNVLPGATTYRADQSIVHALVQEGFRREVAEEMVRVWREDGNLP